MKRTLLLSCNLGPVFYEQVLPYYQLLITDISRVPRDIPCSFLFFRANVLLWTKRQIKAFFSIKHEFLEIKKSNNTPYSSTKIIRIKPNNDIVCQKDQKNHHMREHKKYITSFFWLNKITRISKMYQLIITYFTIHSPDFYPTSYVHAVKHHPTNQIQTPYVLHSPNTPKPTSLRCVDYTISDDQSMCPHRRPALPNGLLVCGWGAGFAGNAPNPVVSPKGFVAPIITFGCGCW